MKILIADHSDMNRDMLAMMLEDEYEILEAESGQECLELLQDHVYDIALLLLDVDLPGLNGFAVLQQMARSGMDQIIPVMMMSGEVAPAYIQHAYDMGVIDYIARPYSSVIVKKRINNAVLSFSKEQQMLKIISRQLGEKEKTNRAMVATLAHLVEFRNGESGLHIQHINTITELLLRKYGERFPDKALSEAQIQTVCLASGLHDIGKITVPEAVLNKPGSYTDEEFLLMKGHCSAGADILEEIAAGWDPSLRTAAKEICRWHHERYDGKGYPDHLSGEEIPLSAQVVSIADVYDSLTSERCYKKAVPHSKAREMISSGACGQFNPDLMACFADIGEELEEYLKTNKTVQTEDNDQSIQQLKEQLEAMNQEHNHKDSIVLESMENLLRQMNSGEQLQEDMIQYLVENHEKLYYDILTGDYNRRYYEEYLKEIPDMNAAADLKLNNYSYILEMYGHDAADQVIQQISHALKHCIRHSDLLVRLGKDEFCILFEDMPQQILQMKMDIIRNKINGLQLESLPEIGLHFSLGSAYGPDSVHTLLLRAQMERQ